ncbi:MAG: IclR family transcriptional regulator, partial [Thermodesulfobacteriota bacterium]
MKQTSSYNSLEKALRILLAFRVDQPSWGVRELSTRLGFSPATVLRMLQALKAGDFVRQDPETRQYHLGNVYFRFMDILQSTHTVGSAAGRYMKRLMSQTQETVHLNVIDDMERICIDSIESAQLLKGVMPVGSRSPLHAGASSKCLLAYSPEDFIDNYIRTVPLTPVTNKTIVDSKVLRSELAGIRNQGYATSLGERTPGLGSVSAPIRNHRGYALASMSLAIPEIRFRDRRHLRFCIAELLATA